ncbi:MAG: zinc ribbon domain-containing protein [Fibrobacteres bacterium]|nr:zinc ribbon domain-containing protein [Fibrobacterota bacterium]
MPNYDYKCSKCGHEFETWQKITDDPLTKCEVAGCRGKVERIIAPSGFILKGSGWYASDYKSTPSKGEKKSDAKEG